MRLAVFLLLLILCQSFAVFPDEIPETSFVFLRQDPAPAEVAYYVDDLRTKVFIIERLPMDSKDFDGMKDGFLQDGFLRATVDGRDYFYRCGKIPGEEGSIICSIDTYYDGNYYLADIISKEDGAKEAELLDLTIISTSYIIDGSIPNESIFQEEPGMSVDESPSTSFDGSSCLSFLILIVLGFFRLGIN
jgi:hypothetical protein